jgi:uncharacterized membrane protein SpoIIM required for sporulation
MDLSEFVNTRRPRWARLSLLLDRIEAAGLEELSLDEAREFGRLYRGASSDLLAARGHAASADLVDYLNALVARGYAQTYPGERTRPADVARFYTHGFPQLVRKEWKVVLAGYLLFALGTGFGYVAMVRDPSAAVVLVPGEHLHLDPNERIQKADEKQMTGDEQAEFSSFLFTHNIQVAFLAFALGISLGVGTVVLLWYNGLGLGALAEVYQAKGHAVWFWAWILPHGVVEISAICLAGAAGLILARAMLMPGERSAVDALREESKIAVKMCLGTIPLFIVAGLTEGTISQIHEPHLPSWVKLTYAAVMGSLLLSYLLLAGRERSRDPANQRG